MQIDYPSSDFNAAVLSAIEEGVEFNVYARIRLFRNAIKRYVDALFNRRSGRVNPLVAIFHIDLVSAVSNAFNSNKYRAKYSDHSGGLLIEFRSAGE